MEYGLTGLDSVGSVGRVARVSDCYAAGLGSSPGTVLIFFLNNFFFFLLAPKWVFLPAT